MDGIHDMGGMHGFGPVRPEPDEPVFHERWHARVFALATALVRGLGNVDAFRHAIERLDPIEYLTAGYYGRWLGALETLADETGLRDATPPRRAGSGPAGALREIERPPRFGVGERVRARNLQTAGHTRLPRYARGRRGVVARVYPAWVFPDTNAHGAGENPQYAYAVRFEGDELWGPDAEPGLAVHVDLFEPYLEPDAEAAR